MSELSDFESVISDVIISPCSFDSFDDDVNANDDNHLKSTKYQTNMNDNNSTCEPSLHDVSLTDSDHSLLEAPKLLNASSPSSVCSTRPLEWDSGADVGYDITPKQQNQDMSTIERIAVNSLVYNANSTSIDCGKKRSFKTKSNSLINLNELEISKNQKSASFEALKCTPTKSDTLPKCRSPMASSLSVSTVIHKFKSLNTDCIQQLNNSHINMIFEQQEKRFEESNISSNNDQKSSESSKESNSTLGSADTAGSWVAKEFRNSTINTNNTDRVNSFEYLPGNTYYNGRDDEQEEYSDKEIKQSTMMLVEAMKKNGLTNELQRKEIFKEIVESFLKIYVQNNKCSSAKSSTDTDQTPIRNDFTSQTSNTANTIVNNPTNNQSSTITFTSPITSSRYGDDVDSKYDESSMDSGRHINLKKCKSKKICTPTNCKKNQGVQCRIQYSSTNNGTNENSKQSSSTKSNVSKENEKNYKKNSEDVNKKFEEQMIWFHTNYMKTERENQLLWINNQISHLNNLKRLFNTHEELKKNWNLYKQKQTLTNKSKFRSNEIPVSNTSSDFTTTTKTDSTISSKPFSVTSRYDDTDVESSTTICDHVHYKNGILVDKPKSIKKCCLKTLNNIDARQKQAINKMKTTMCQTETINEKTVESYRKCLSQKSGGTYTIDHKYKPISSNKSSISYDIIFKPTSRCSKETDLVKNKTKQQKHSISIACQTNEIPFEPKSSLQEYLMINRPDYVCRAEERQNILTDMASLRNKRKQLKRDLLITNNFENNVPPHPLTVKRIMNQREMRRQTERKYRKCPEVKNKKVEVKRKEDFQTNKIMANIFNKRLQKKTLKGKVDLSNSVSVCSL